MIQYYCTVQLLACNLRILVGSVIAGGINNLYYYSRCQAILFYFVVVDAELAIIRSNGKENALALPFYHQIRQNDGDDMFRVLKDPFDPNQAVRERLSNEEEARQKSLVLAL